MKKILSLLLLSLSIVSAMDFAKDDAEHQMTKSLNKTTLELKDLENVKIQNAESDNIKKIVFNIKNDLINIQKDGLASMLYGNPLPLHAADIDNFMNITYAFEPYTGYRKCHKRKNSHNSYDCHSFSHYIDKHPVHVNFFPSHKTDLFYEVAIIFAKKYATPILDFSLDIFDIASYEIQEPYNKIIASDKWGSTHANYIKYLGDSSNNINNNYTTHHIIKIEKENFLEQHLQSIIQNLVGDYLNNYYSIKIEEIRDILINSVITSNKVKFV